MSVLGHPTQSGGSDQTPGEVSAKCHLTHTIRVRVCVSSTY